MLPSQRPRLAASEVIGGCLERLPLDMAHRRQPDDCHDRAGANRLTAHDGADFAAPMDMLPRDRPRNDPHPMALARRDWQPGMPALSHEPTEIRIARMLQ